MTFDPKALAAGLRAIYNREVNVTTEIERHIFEETLRRFNLATAKGLSESIDPEVITDRFLYELRTNNAVFSAFRTHRMQNDIAAQLIDRETGQLKSFDKWKRDIKGMTDHYCHQWLQTEYDTAVIRAHQAADWKHFLEEQDVFPNVRWMPTTSITPDPLHEHYWTKKLTLPVNHPFWQEHRPGDRWNCKCSLQQTDEPVNAEALDGYTPPLPMPGLDNNPAQDSKLFSDTHPYITDAYPGAAMAVKNALNISPAWIPAETIADAEEFATRYVKQIGLDRTFKGKVSYKGIDLSMANRINHTLVEAFDRIDMPKISGIKAISGSSATGKKVFNSLDSVAAYDPIQKGIYLNTDILGSAEKLNAYIQRSRDAFEIVKKNLDKIPTPKRVLAERYIKAGRELVDDSLEGMILHELGHHAQWNIVPTKLINELGDKMEAIAVKISGYSGTNKSEYIAESFVSWMRGENRIDQRLQELFDSKLKAVPSVQRVLKKSPSSMRRTEEEKAEIIRRWEERKNIRENEKAVAKELGLKVPKKGMTFEEADNSRTNPLFATAPEYRVNCQCCVVSHEMRMRGWNVEAIANKKIKGSVPYSLSHNTEYAFIDRATNSHPEVFSVTSRDSKMLIEKFAKTVKTPGRYHVRFSWRGGRGGHIITYEVKKDGSSFFYDPQVQYSKPKTPEEFYKTTGYKIKSLGKGMEYYRVDNLNISLDYGAKAVKKKA